jgi:hypothetical protein
LFTLREEHSLRVFQNRKWREAGEESIMRSFITCTIIIRLAKSRMKRWMGHVARMAEMRNVYKILLGKPERKTPLARTERT